MTKKLEMKWKFEFRKLTMGCCIRKKEVGDEEKTES